MRSSIFLIVWIVTIILSVQARSLRNLDSLNDSDLLTLFQNRNTNFYGNNNDDDSSNHYRNNDVMSPRNVEQTASTDRRFFLFPTKHPNRRSRPPHSYGRKSHWDTYFGKK